MVKTIKFKYIFDQNYNPIYVNGAYGGINTQGEIIINFYLERIALPISQSYEVEDGKQIDHMNPTVSEPSDLESSRIRFIENGVVLKLENAIEIHAWLGTLIQNLQSQIKTKD